MANDAIEFYRQIVLKHIEEVKSTISDTKYRVYIAIVNECTDLEVLKNMADFGMQDEFIAYSKGIDERLGEYNTTVKELQEVCEGGYEITNLDEIKREELKKKRETTQAEVADTIDKVLHSYDEYGDTIEALSKLEQIDDESEYGIEVHMELNVDDFDDEEITEEDIERENGTYEDEIEDIEELDEDDPDEEFSKDKLEDTEDELKEDELKEDELEDDSIDEEFDTEELEDEDEDNIEDEEEQGEEQCGYWYYDDGEYYDDYDEEEYKEDPKTVEELYEEIGNDTDEVEEGGSDGEDNSLFDFDDEEDTDDSDEEYLDDGYDEDTYDENEDYFDELEDSDSIEENDSINMDENEDYVGISETLEFEDDTQEEPDEYLDDDQYEVDEEEDGEEDEEYLEDESEAEIEEDDMQFEDDFEDEEDTDEDQFDLELEDNDEEIYVDRGKKEDRQVKPKQRQKVEVFDTSTAHGKQAQDTLTAMTRMFSTAEKQGKKVNNYFEKGRNTMKRKMTTSGKRKDGKPSMFNLSDNIDLD